MKGVKGASILPFPNFSVIAEDLGKSLSRLHKARCRMDEVTGLQQLSILLMSLETIAPTQKVLADGAPLARPMVRLLTPMGATSR
jgi:hypothetical protein